MSKRHSFMRFCFHCDVDDTSFWVIESSTSVFAANFKDNWQFRREEISIDTLFQMKFNLLFTLRAIYYINNSMWGKAKQDIWSFLDFDCVFPPNASFFVRGWNVLLLTTAPIFILHILWSIWTAPKVFHAPLMEYWIRIMILIIMKYI